MELANTVNKFDKVLESSAAMFDMLQTSNTSADEEEEPEETLEETLHTVEDLEN